MRHIFRALVIGAGVAIAAPATAQTAAKPAQMIVNNAPPGTNIDVFMDAGKVQSVNVNQQGTAGFSLDLLNLGKPTGQLYVEVCKDGQRLRIISDGTTVPEDEGCSRKKVGAAFTFTCTNKITLNWAAAKASFAGCGALWTNKMFTIPVAIGVGGVAVSQMGGGSSYSNSPPVAQQPVVQQQPSIQVPTINTTPANNSNPAPPPPVVANFDGAVVLSYNHPGGSTSIFCGRISTTPPQAGGFFTVRVSGPGVVTVGSIGGVLNAAGIGLFQAVINAFGPYLAEITLTGPSGGTKTISGSATVSAPQGQCPQ